MNGGRRDVLKMLAVATGAAALTPSATRKAQAIQEVEKSPLVPWPYKRLDAASAAERGYLGYYTGACCYGAFEGIVGQLRETVGAPYTLMPSEMMIFGEGGVAGISSLCGTLIGASSAIFLATGSMEKEKKEQAFALIRELFNWYGQEELPNYRPKNPKFEIKPSIAYSPLCHVSVSRWCEATGLKSFSKERAERCAWLTASVVKYTVELLNGRAAATFKPVHLLSAQAQSCRTCHDQGGSLENSRGMMECKACHSPEATERHP